MAFIEKIDKKKNLIIVALFCVLTAIALVPLSLGWFSSGGDEIDFEAHAISGYFESGTGTADDPYIRYSGYLNLFEYVFSALYSANPQKYSELAASINQTIYSEWKGYSDFRAQYEDNFIGELSESVNDAYLTVQGAEGVKSYGLVVDLAVAYYKNRTE